MLTPTVIEQVENMSNDNTVEGQDHSPTTPPGVEYEVEQLETEFLAVISHELRSPLAAIKGYAATLRRHGHKLGRAEREEFLQAIDEASDRLDVMISRLLELSRLEAGALKPNLIPVDVLHLVREAVSAAEHRWSRGAPAVGQCIFIPPEQSSVPVVLTDLRLLREALDIVLENAVKYSPSGGTIHVTLQSDDTMLTIRVQDNGSGIGPDHLQRIFGCFYRVDTRLARDVEGAGVGLAICKRIMALHGGEIWAESELGVGSTFVMALPLVNPR